MWKYCDLCDSEMRVFSVLANTKPILHFGIWNKLLYTVNINGNLAKIIIMKNLVLCQESRPFWFCYTCIIIFVLMSVSIKPLGNCCQIVFFFILQGFRGIVEPKN